jgi:hypothetical protein
MQNTGMTVHGIDIVAVIDYGLFYDPSDLLQVMPKVGYFVIVVPTRDTEHMISRTSSREADLLPDQPRERKGWMKRPG